MNSLKVGGHRKQVMSNANWHAIMNLVKSSVEQMEKLAMSLCEQRESGNSGAI